MRLQILELPTKYLGDAAETPFVLVVSEAKQVVTSQEQLEVIRAPYGSLREIPNCEHVFVTDDVVEIWPA